MAKNQKKLRPRPHIKNNNNSNNRLASSHTSLDMNNRQSYPPVFRANMHPFGFTAPTPPPGLFPAALRHPILPPQYPISHGHPPPPPHHLFPQQPITFFYPINPRQPGFIPAMENPLINREIVQQDVSPHSSSESTPPSKREIQRQQSIRSLLLKPMENPTDVVVIVLPNTPQKFIIHHALLSHFSPYFRALLANLAPPPPPFTAPLKIKMFNYNNELDLFRNSSVPMDLNEHQPLPQDPKEWESIEVQVVVRLPGTGIMEPPTILLSPSLGDVKGKVMGAFVNWLYLGEFGKVVDHDDSLVAEKGTGQLQDVDACTLIELWVLAGKLGAKTCQNDCVVGIEKLRKKNNTIETGMLTWVYNHTTDYHATDTPCPLRHLLIDQCAWLLDERWLELRGDNGLENEQVFPRAALVDLFARMRVLLRGGKGLDHSIGIELDHIEERRGDRYWVKEDLPTSVPAAGRA